VEKILEEIGASGIPLVRVYNKIDLLPHKDDLLAFNDRPGADRIYLSAKTGEGVAALKDRLRGLLFKDRQLFYLRLPRGDRSVLEALARRALILKTQEYEDHLDVRVIAAPDSLKDFGPYLQGGMEA
jgi:GTPase